MAEKTRNEEGGRMGIVPRNISVEMRESYLDYAMSVITARALPDVRDGLKPVHRRILYTLQQMGLHAGAKFRKCAAIVGDCMGRYHPHGDSAIYDALVKMAQDFSMRYPLVLGQGNFGCFTGDTRVHLIDGRMLSFIELIAEKKIGKKNYTYTYNEQAGQIEIALLEHPRVTRKDAELVRVTFDNGESVRCTPDHRFMLRDGSYREAQRLKSGDSLMPLYTRLSIKEDDVNIVGYEMVLQPDSHAWVYAHHLADEWNLAHSMYTRSAGKVRHHKDFNKRNNNPDNIVRLQWREHWQAHYEVAAQRHQNDATYRERLASGRAAYYANPKVREERAERMRERNRALWRSPAYRAQRASVLKQRWRDSVYKAKRAIEASTRLKEAWKSDEFRSRMSKVKSAEMRERWQGASYRVAQTERMRLLSQELWLSEAHRAHISDATKRAWQRAEYRALHTERAKRQWENPSYRIQFPREHFVRAAQTLWENPATRAMHSEKMKRQRENPNFLGKTAHGRARANERRMALDPFFIECLTERARVALREKWSDPSYKQGVMRSKILGYVKKLLAVSERVTEEMYEASRTTGIPRFEKALAYFRGADEMQELARQHNHRVVSVERLSEREDVYDVTVRGTHNFALAGGVFVHNSIDGDPAAAMRYSEAKMSRLSSELLRDLEKETVDWRPNYDATRREPIVLPAAVPNLLLNGTLGIAVGMATNIPPHNLGEVAAALAHLIDNPEATGEDMLEHIKGPDFPTGAVLYGVEDLHHAYATGRGGVVVRGEAEISDHKDGTTQIIITSIPYRTNKSDLIESIADLVRDKKLEGIKELRDESAKDIRIVVGLKNTAQPKQVLNFIYKHTGLEDTFHFNMVALDEGVPRTFSLKGILEKFVAHRIDVVERRGRFDLARAEERAHILVGLKKALDHIDKIIKTIRAARDVAAAHAGLVREFRFSDKQATAILEMRLQKLAGLERTKVEEELAEVEKLILDLTALLTSPARIRGVIKRELAEVAGKYADERRTRIVRHGIKEMTDEDLIPDEESVLVLTQGGYVKRTNPSEYRRQRRGGIGVVDMNTKEEDFVTALLTASTLSDMLFFTNRGKVYKTKMYDVPEGRRATRGKSIMNFLPLGSGEEVSSVLAMPKEARAQEELSVMMVTRQGTTKRVAAKSFHEVRTNGLLAMGISSDDQLVSTFFVGRGDDVILATASGQAIRFKAALVREMGRTAAGVRGIRLRKGDSVVGADAVRREATAPTLFAVSEKGFGKRTALKEYKVQGRGGAGVKTFKVSAKTGRLIRTSIVEEGEAEAVAMSKRGQVIRLALHEIPLLGRATQGVRIMKLREGDAIASTVCL